jgi:hypothetical protein
LGGYWFQGQIALGANSTHLFFPAWDAATGLETYTLPLNEDVPDTVAPRITAAAPDPDAPSARLRATFSEDVSASLTASDLQLANPTTGQSIDPAHIELTFDPNTLTATFTFPGLPGAMLPDGNYRATIRAGSVLDDSGNALAADFSIDFFVLAADANRDRKVDFADLVILAQNYNTTGGATFAKGDFNHDGDVDFEDLVLLAQRYNTTLPPAAGAIAAASPARVSSLTQRRRPARPAVPIRRSTPPPNLLY